MTQSSDSKPVGVRVSGERYDELEQFVNENEGEYNSVPDLFRKAAAHEMSEDYGLLSLGSSGGGGTGEEFGELVASVSRLRNDINELSEEVSALSDEVQSGISEKIIERMSAVHTILPSDPEDGLSYSEVADRFEDMDNETAWKTLIQLYEEVPSVHRTTQGKWYAE